jgi:glycopeptide antibiotics resistance protein
MIIVDWYNARTYLLVFLVGCAILGPAAIVVGRRTKSPTVVSVLYAMAVATVGALTLPTRFADMHAFPAPQFTVGGFFKQFFADSAPIHAFTDLLTTPEHLANVLLYVPVGVLGCLFLGKWWRTFGAAVALTFIVELMQALSGVRDGSAEDFYHNCLGAAVGVAIVLSVRLLGSLDGRSSTKTAESVESS